MRKSKKCVQVGAVLVVLLLLAAASAGGQTKDQVIQDLRAHADTLTRHDIDAFAATLTDDFVSDNVSAKPRNKSEMVAAIGAMLKNSPTLQNFQGGLLVSGSFAVFDECSFVMMNPKTNRQYRIFHLDIVELRGSKVKVMTTFGDAAAGNVALGVIEPPVPAPPNRLTRVFPAPAPEPTWLPPAASLSQALSRFNSHDLASMAKMLGEDARVMISPLLDEVGRDAYIAWQEVMFTAFPDLTLTPIRSFDMGDGWAVSEVTMTGTQKGPYLGHAPSGKPIRLRAAYLGRYDAKGLATIIKLYYDSLNILTQLGYQPVSAQQ